MKIKRIYLYLSFVIMFFISCENRLENVQPAEVKSNSNISQKATLAATTTNHEIYAGFFRMWKDASLGGGNTVKVTDVPDGTDVVILFGFDTTNTTLSNAVKNIYVPTLHQRGIKVLMTGDLNIPSDVTHDAAGYETTALKIMTTLNNYGLDGYDIDVESNPTGSTLTDMVGVYTALSKYLGPKSGTGKILTFDTNQPGTNNMFRQVYTLMDYVFLQIYGQGATNLSYYWNTYSPYISSSQFVPGFSFYEENGYPSNVWYDVNYPENNTGKAYDIAKWEPTGLKKGGVFSYAFDRDMPLKSSTDNTMYIADFKVSKDIMGIINQMVIPATTIVSGATYTLVSAVNNSSVLDVSEAGNTDGTKVQLWSSNGTNAQKWVVTSIGNGYFTLQPLCAAGKVLNDTGQSITNGIQQTIWTSNNSTAQQWKITAVDSNYFTLSPACATTMCLDVSSAGTTNGTKVQIWTANGTNAQKWKFVKQ